MALIKLSARVLLGRVRYGSTKASPALASWIAAVPKEPVQREEDHVSLSKVRGLVSTLELDGVAQKWNSGDNLPPTWSLVLFSPVSTSTSLLGFDGTENGKHHPPDQTLERMWVSGSWQFDPDVPQLKVGDEVVCESQVESVLEKTGKDGRTGWYVNQVRKMSRPGEEASPSVVERRTHLYRHPLASESAPTMPPPPAKALPPKAAREPSFSDSFLPTPEILFRFSALTFNTHRIHWDKSYAVGVEKREGLVVHGPLTCLLLLNTLRHELATTDPSAHILGFDYRATNPLTVGKLVRFCGKWINGGEKHRRECELWAEDEGGKVYMTGKAVVRSGSS